MTRALVNGLLVLVLLVSAALGQPDGPRGISVMGVDSEEGGGPALQAAALAPVAIGPFTVSGQPVESWHTCFERELDAPSFYNFESYQQYGSFKHRFVNEGTCYGISMFTLRYFQWFILPHLLTDAQLAAARPRVLPGYARQVARDMGLPGWVLESPTSDGSGGRLTARQRAARIAPWRLRTLLTGKADLTRALGQTIEKIAKKECAMMFDNQRLLVNLGSRIAQFIDRTIFRRANRDTTMGRLFFGVGGFGLMKQYISDTSLGAFEVGFFGSKLKPMWGHSVVGFRITRFQATKRGSAGTFEAYRVDLYDSNDPTNTSDDCLWFFPSEQAFAPSKGYAEFYDGENPLLPKGKEFLLSAQLGPSADPERGR
ncbi:MAG: hypothetical protein HY815_08925 [Candidatus Riflebacteria bacterium]|nr:hypothetical protein [Candidatus Riflebacteria bacterium]